MKNSKKVPATKASKGASPNNAKTPQRNPNAKSKETSASKELKQSHNISPINQSKDDNVNIQETDLDQKSKKSKSPNKESTKSPIKTETPSNHNEENDNPSEKVISTRAYLEQTVVSVVQEGMLELARTKPDKPLEFLGNFILQRAKQNK